MLKKSFWNNRSSFRLSLLGNMVRDFCALCITGRLSWSLNTRASSSKRNTKSLHLDGKKTKAPKIRKPSLNEIGLMVRTRLQWNLSHLHPSSSSWSKTSYGCVVITSRETHWHDPMNKVNWKNLWSSGNNFVYLSILLHFLLSVKAVSFGYREIYVQWIRGKGFERNLACFIE